MRGNLMEDLVSEALRRRGFLDSPGLVWRLAQFLELLQRWNRTFNLTRIIEPEEMVLLHLEDTLTAIPLLRRIAPGQGRVLDVGTGAGIPAFPVAALQPEYRVDAVDKVKKKIVFVQQAVAMCHLPNLRAIHKRVEDLREPPYDVIISRAFSRLELFTRCSRHLLKEGGHWLVMKGRLPSEELVELDARGLTWETSDVKFRKRDGSFVHRHLILIRAGEGRGAGPEADLKTV